MLEGKTKKWIRRALWTLLALWAVVVIALQVVLNSTVLGKIADSFADEYVDGEVAYSKIKASMFRSFPNLNVTVDDFSITYPHGRYAAFDTVRTPGSYLAGAGRNQAADTLVNFDELSLSVNYLAAVTGRIKVRHAVLARPRIFAHRYGGGRANWDIFRTGGKTEEDTSSAGFSLPDLTIKKISLEGEPFAVYTDPQDTVAGCIFLKSLSAKGRYRAGKGRIERVSLSLDSLFAAGRLPADTVAFRLDRLRVKEKSDRFDIDLASNVFLGLKFSGRMSIPVEVKGKVTPDLKGKTVAVEDLQAKVATIGLQASGKVDFSGDKTLIKAKAGIKDASISGLVDCFGDNFPVLKNLHTDAVISLDATCDGFYDSATGSLPPLSVRVRIPDSQVGWEGFVEKGRLDLDATASSVDGRLTAEIPDFCFNINGMKVSLSGSVDDVLGEDPEIQLSSDIHIVIDSLTRYLPDSLGLSAHGDLEGIIEGGFRLSQLNLFNFSETGLEGLVESNNISVSIPKDTLFAYLGHTDISLGSFSHDEEDHEGHGEEGHSHKGLSITVDSLFAEYGASTFIRGTGINISAHNSEELIGGRPDKHPVHGHLDIGSIGMMDIDSCFVGALGLANTFKLSQKIAGGQTVPYISLTSRNKDVTVRDGVNRFSVADARLSVAAHPNSVERQVRKKHLLDSLQKVYPGVKRDSLLRKAFRRMPVDSLPDYLSEKDFEKNDIKIQLGESISNYIKTWDIDGNVSLAEGLVITPYYPLDNRIAGFSGTFSNNSIELKELSLTSGSSDINASGRLTGLRRILVSGKGMLDLNLGITSKQIDVNEILIALNSGKNYVPTDRKAALEGMDDSDYLESVKEASASDTTSLQPLFVVPANLNAKVSIEADRIRYSKLETSWMCSDIVMKERCLQATNTLATTNMGDVYLEGFYSTRTKKDLKAGFDLTLAGITAEKVIELFPAVDSIVPMLKAFKGMLDCEVAATTAIDTSMNILLPTLSGIVKIDGKDLSLVESEELDKLRRTLMFKDKDSSHIESLSIKGIIKDNQLEIFPFVLNVDRYSVAASGLQRFDQKFKYHLSALKSPIPFKFGINLNGTFDNWNWRLGRSKYKSQNVPLFDTQVEGLKVNLTDAIHKIFEKGVEQALKQNEMSQKAIEAKKNELDYSAALTEDLSSEEKKTLETLESVTTAVPDPVPDPGKEDIYEY
jgi:hypothetical protein